MNKSELIEAISEETTFSKKDIARILSSLTRIVERTLQKGGKVSITGFGSYWLFRKHGIHFRETVRSVRP